jgi:hypothetical protein
VAEPAHDQRREHLAALYRLEKSVKPAPRDHSLPRLHNLGSAARCKPDGSQCPQRMNEGDPRRHGAGSAKIKTKKDFILRLHWRR